MPRKNIVLHDPIQTTSADLIWQSPLEGGGSRRRLRVAKLRQHFATGNVTFNYSTGTPEFETAVSEGFKGYIGIPFEREDNSDAINTLARRLPNSERPDYGEFLARFGLRQEHGLSTLSLLAYTGAKLTSDSFSIADTFEGFDRPFDYIFDVAGRRHHVTFTPTPEVNEPVYFQPEPDNPRDKNAVSLLDEMGNSFGYVNACQAEAVLRWINDGKIDGKIFRFNGSANYPRLFVIAHVQPCLKARAA